MKYLRIKVKHLLAIIMIILLAGLVRVSFMPHIMYLQAQFFQKTNKTEVSNAYYKKLAEKYPESRLSVEALHNRYRNEFRDCPDALNFMDETGGYSTFGTWSTGRRIMLEDLKNINAEFNTLTRYHSSHRLYYKVKMEVALLNWFGGNTTDALGMMNDVVVYGSKPVAEEALLYLGIMNMQLGEFDKAGELLGSRTMTDKAFKKYRKGLMDWVNFATGRTKEFKLSVDMTGVNFITVDTILDLNNYWPFENGFIRFDRLPEGKGAVAGKVTAGTSPIKGAVLKLHRATTFEDGGEGYDSLADAVTFSGPDGSYRFDDVPDGSFMIEVNIPWHRVRNMNYVHRSAERITKVSGGGEAVVNLQFNTSFDIDYTLSPDEKFLKVEWKPYPGAAYYSVRTGPLEKIQEKHIPDFFNATFYTGNIKETSFTVDIEEYRDIPARGTSYDNKGVFPGNFLGAFYQGGEYGITISALDSDGNIIAESRKVDSGQGVSVFSIAGVPLSPADRLFLDRKYEEAIKQYEKQYAENPDDLHSLRMLAHIYLNGYKQYESKGLDADKALKYFLELHGKSPSGYTCTSLGDTYGRIKKDYGKALQYYLEARGKHGLTDCLWDVGDIYLKLGEMAKARQYFEEYAGKTGDNYVYDRILFIDMLTGKHKALEEDLKLSGNSFTPEQKGIILKFADINTPGRFKEFFRLMDKGRRSEAEEWLKAQPDDEFKVFYQGMLALTYLVDEGSKPYQEAGKKLKAMQADAVLVDTLRLMGKSIFGLEF